MVYAVYYLLLFKAIRLTTRNWRTYVKEQCTLLPLLLICPAYVTLVKVGLPNIGLSMSMIHWYTLCMDWGLLVYFVFAWQQNSMITRSLEALDYLVASGEWGEIAREDILAALLCLPKIKYRNWGMTLSTLVLSIPQGSIAAIVFVLLTSVVYPLWRRHYRRRKPLVLRPINTLYKDDSA